jgi:hypothetical protein
MEKKLAYLMAPAMLLISTLISCNKGDDSPTLPDPHKPIIQKWSIVRHVDTTVFFNGPTTYYDYRPTNGDYLDFRGDGKLYRLENGVMDTSTFTISHDTIVAHHKYAPYTTTFKVEISTMDSLQLNGRSYVIVNSHDYRITHYYLNRK